VTKVNNDWEYSVGVGTPRKCMFLAWHMMLF